MHSLSWWTILLITINYHYVTSYIMNNICDCTVSIISASPAFPESSSKTGNDGTYISNTTDPLGPWYGRSILFQGTNNGNVTIYDYAINCNLPCWITTITLEGVAWWNPNIITLYNDDKSTALATINANGGNNFHSHTMDMSKNPFYSTSFRLIETNNICCWRYRSLITMTMIAATTPSPTTPPGQIPKGHCNCTVSVMSASLRWDVGETYSGFTSTSIDPLAPWYKESVQFKGTSHTNLTVYDYAINCIESCWITSVNIQGAAFQNSEFILYNQDKSNIISSMNVNSGNLFASYTLDMTGINDEYYANTFRFVEFNTVGMWRYRSSIAITMVPEQTDDPTMDPTIDPTYDPTHDPTYDPTSHPTTDPTNDPTKGPTSDPTKNPTKNPTVTTNPTTDPTADPTLDPTNDPTSNPTNGPTLDPTTNPIQTTKVTVVSPVTTRKSQLTVTSEKSGDYDGKIDDETTTTESNDSVEDEVNVSDETNFDYKYGIIAGICVIICCILCALYYMRKSRNKKRQQQDEKHLSPQREKKYTDTATMTTYGQASMQQNTSNTRFAEIASASPTMPSGNEFQLSSFVGINDMMMDEVVNQMSTPGYIDDDEYHNGNDTQIVSDINGELEDGECYNQEAVGYDEENRTGTGSNNKYLSDDEIEMTDIAIPGSYGSVNNMITPNGDENVQDDINLGDDEFIIAEESEEMGGIDIVTKGNDEDEDDEDDEDDDDLDVMDITPMGDY